MYWHGNTCNLLQLRKVFFNDLESDYRVAFHTCLQAWSTFLLLPSYETFLPVCSVQSMDWHILCG